ncbi:MAG: CRISPR-associated helicase Cas3', partial [Gemmatimonadaceae bacterium]
TGIAAPRLAGLRTFAELTKKLTPTPAQKWASRVKLPDGPVLVILEDVTGAGKTEAAQMIVHRLMAAGRAAGAYWAMPTQATANAMYARQANTVGALFADDRDAPRPSVILAHGQTRLHERFQGTVLRHPEARLEAAASSEPGLPAAAACAAFLADNRRAALLADIGAGTVDQALLGALPSRFNTVRLFGMADKVLVFDEAHAYDRYMGVEAEQLLRFQAALGGSAVMLSATLSLEQRERFATAWMEGLAEGRRRVAPLFGGAPPALVESMRYPLATVVSAAAEPVKERAIAAARWSRRSVHVRFVRTGDEALAHVLESARRGAAVAWVRNTVDDCLAAAAAVREATGREPIVFHARFAQCDRQERERQVLELFGEHGEAAARRGAILIGSQVIEQSLDLDFDVMVTDLAPVDLLIQRVGRLWRHPSRKNERPSRLKRELVVLSPPTDIVPEKDWLSAVLPRTRYVYRNLGVLWRSAKALAEEPGAIVTPKGLRPLVEAVYGSDETPEQLLAATQAAEGKDLGDASAAHQASLELSGG